MKIATLILVLMPFVPAGGAAADLSGKWNFDGDVMGNAVNLACDVKQSPQAKLSGSCDVNGGMATADIAGDVTDQALQFAITVQGYTLTYTGKIEGDTASGSIEVAGVSGTFTGKRAK